MKEYAVYKGDKFLLIGTIREIAEFLNVSQSTVSHYKSATHRKRRTYENRMIFLEFR